MSYKGKIKIVRTKKAELLTPEEKERVRTVAEKLLKKDHVQRVVEACLLYRMHLIFTAPSQKMWDKDIGKLDSSIGQPTKKGRGRPKGSEDWPAKVLVNDLASIWQTEKEEKPGQEESKFGAFVRDIANVLDVKDGKGNPVTWSWIVRVVTKEPMYERFRKLLRNELSVFGDRGALAAAADDDSWENWLEVQREWVAEIIRRMNEAVSDAKEKKRLEEKIKKLPGAENYIITVERKEPKVVEIPPEKKSG